MQGEEWAVRRKVVRRPGLVNPYAAGPEDVPGTSGAGVVAVGMTVLGMAGLLVGAGTASADPDDSSSDTSSFGGDSSGSGSFGVGSSGGASVESSGATAWEPSPSTDTATGSGGSVMSPTPVDAFVRPVVAAPVANPVRLPVATAPATVEVPLLTDPLPVAETTTPSTSAPATLYAMAPTGPTGVPEPATSSVGPGSGTGAPGSVASLPGDRTTGTAPVLVAAAEPPEVVPTPVVGEPVDVGAFDLDAMVFTGDTVQLDLGEAAGSSTASPQAVSAGDPDPLGTRVGTGRRDGAVDGPGWVPITSGPPRAVSVADGGASSSEVLDPWAEIELLFPEMEGEELPIEVVAAAYDLPPEEVADRFGQWRAALGADRPEQGEGAATSRPGGTPQAEWRTLLGEVEAGDLSAAELADAYGVSEYEVGEALRTRRRERADLDARTARAVQRDFSSLARRATGETVESVAERHGVSVERVRELRREWAEGALPADEREQILFARELGGDFEYGVVDPDTGQRGPSRAVVTPEMLDAADAGLLGSRADRYNIPLPGRRDLPGGVYGHAIAQMFGGSGRVPGGLVALLGVVNGGPVKAFELAVQREARAGRTVHYEFEPVYPDATSRGAPSSVRLTAQWTDQDGQEQVRSEEIPNRPDAYVDSEILGQGRRMPNPLLLRRVADRYGLTVQQARERYVQLRGSPEGVDLPEPAELGEVPEAAPGIPEELEDEFVRRFAREQNPAAAPGPTETLKDLAARMGLPDTLVGQAYREFRRAQDDDGRDPRTATAELTRQLVEDQLEAADGELNLDQTVADLGIPYSRVKSIRDAWLARTGVVPPVRQAREQAREEFELAFLDAALDGVPLDTAPFKGRASDATLRNWYNTLAEQYGQRPARRRATSVVDALTARLPELVQDRADGLTRAELARKYGVNTTAVGQVLAAAPQPTARGPRAGTADARLAEIQRDRAAGIGVPEIAERYGLTPNAVYQAMARARARAANRDVTTVAGADGVPVDPDSAEADPPDQVDGSGTDGAEQVTETGRAASAEPGGQVVRPDFPRFPGLEPAPGSQSEGVPMPSPGLSPPRAERWEIPPLEEPLVPAMRNDTGHDRVGDDLEMPVTRSPLPREGDRLPSSPVGHAPGQGSQGSAPVAGVDSAGTGSVPVASPALTCDAVAWVVCAGSPGHPAGQPRVGPAVVGAAIVGPKIVGPAIVGPKIVGPAIVGPKIVGPGLVGSAVGYETEGAGTVGPGLVGAGLVGPGIVGTGTVGPEIVGVGIAGPKFVGPGIVGPKPSVVPGWVPAAAAGAAAGVDAVGSFVGGVVEAWQGMNPSY